MKHFQKVSKSDFTACRPTWYVTECYRLSGNKYWFENKSQFDPLPCVWYENIFHHAIMFCLWNALSYWFLGFSMFLFLQLQCHWRCFKWYQFLISEQIYNRSFYRGIWSAEICVISSWVRIGTFPENNQHHGGKALDILEIFDFIFQFLLHFPDFWKETEWIICIPVKRNFI